MDFEASSPRVSKYLCPFFNESIFQVLIIISEPTKRLNFSRATINTVTQTVHAHTIMTIWGFQSVKHTIIAIEIRCQVYV